MDDTRLLAWASIVIGALSIVVELIHHGAGLYPAGVALGFWLSAGWLWLRSAA